MKSIKYKIEESREPEGNKTHIVVVEKEGDKSYYEGRVFKGTLEECKEYKAQQNVTYTYSNQTQQVLRYLEKHKKITTLECYKKLNITDLQHAIMELRKQGYNITDKWIHKKNLLGRAIKFKEYRLEV